LGQAELAQKLKNNLSNPIYLTGSFYGETRCQTRKLEINLVAAFVEM
jgi:hypothetical protein